MVRNIFLLTIFAASFVISTHADQITIQADLAAIDECPDYTTCSTRALITELKKLKSDIFLYYAGQVPCALLSALTATGALICTAKVATREWHPLALIGTIACASISPACAALFLELENKKILARYNIEEINEQLTLRS